MVRQKIFDAASKLIDEQGYSVSVRTIAKEADVNVAAISYHFGSKDNLVNEIIIGKLGALKTIFDKLDDPSINGIERLKRFIIDVIELIKREPILVNYVMDQQDLFKTRYEYQNYLESVGYSKFRSLIGEITNTTDIQVITVICEQVLAANIVSYMTESELAKDNEHFTQEVDYHTRIDIFINNYFHRYMVNEKE